ncbi:MAG: hypothetical protein KGJ78_11250 [Alphaproteobacteria bacterium]|nr:hypothetical protein [Alphaproteobacteria bacterium]
MRFFRLEWPEKVAAIFGLVVALPIFVFWLLLAVGLRSAGDVALDAEMLRGLAEAEIMVALPIWLVLRGALLIRQCALAIMRRLRSRRGTAGTGPARIEPHLAQLR